MAHRALVLVVSAAGPTGRLVREARLPLPAFLPVHPALAEAGRRVLRSGATECHVGPDGNVLYLARGVAEPRTV